MVLYTAYKLMDVRCRGKNNVNNKYSSVLQSATGKNTDEAVIDYLDKNKFDEVYNTSFALSVQINGRISRRQLYFTINLEEILCFLQEKMPYLCGFWRFANA